MEQLSFLNKMENFILNWTGAIILGMGGAGLMLTIYFDQIARGERATTWGWLQVAGVIFCVSLVIFGILVEKKLLEIKEILKDWIKK